MIVRLFKLLVGFGVLLWDAFKNLLLRSSGRKPRGSCIVLYYHAIRRDQRARFARQMDDLVRLTTPIRADNCEALPDGQRSSVVTFDDGFVSVLENALPELQSRKIPATLFVPTGCLGTRPSWIRDGRGQNAGEVVVSRDQLRRLNEMELVTVGSHSVTHPNFAKLANAEAESELRRSKSDLQMILQRDITLFSFPHGAHDDRSVSLAGKAGYRRVFTISPVPAFASADEFVTGRILADPDDWKWEFRLKLTGAYRWLASASKLKRRLLSGNATQIEP